MVRKLPSEARRRVIDLWVEGHTYETITKQTGVSHGSIASILDEERKRTPDLDELRGLKADLKRMGVNLLDAVRGAKLAETMNKLVSSTDELPKILEYYSKVEGRPIDIAESGLRLLKLEQETKLSPSQLVADYEEKFRKRNELEAESESLASQNRELKIQLKDLQNLRKLSDTLQKYRIDTSKVEGFLSQNLELESLGFSPKTARMVAEELRKLSLNPASAATRLTEAVRKYSDLEKALLETSLNLQSLEAEKKRLTEQVNSKREDIRALNEQRQNIATLLETDERIHKEKVDRLDSDYKAGKSALEAQLQAELNAEYKRRKEELDQKHLEEVEKYKKDLDSWGQKIDKLIAIAEEYKELIEKHKTTVRDLTEKRDLLLNQTKMLEEGLSKASTVEQKLAQIQADIDKTKSLLIFANLLASPETVKVGAKAVMEHATAYIKALQGYITAHRSEIGSPVYLNSSLENLLKVFSAELIR